MNMSTKIIILRNSYNGSSLKSLDYCVTRYIILSKQKNLKDLYFFCKEKYFCREWILVLNYRKDFRLSINLLLSKTCIFRNSSKTWNLVVLWN